MSAILDIAVGGFRGARKLDINAQIFAGVNVNVFFLVGDVRTENKTRQYTE
jgi:hypothetical protein